MSASKIRVYSIIFIQREDDITRLCADLGAESLSDIPKDALIEHLKQWEQGSLREHDSNLYDADGIDTPFLGYRLDRDNEREGYLFTRHLGLNYCGLSYFKREGV